MINSTCKFDVKIKRRNQAFDTMLYPIMSRKQNMSDHKNHMNQIFKLKVSSHLPVF